VRLNIKSRYFLILLLGLFCVPSGIAAPLQNLSATDTVDPLQSISKPRRIGELSGLTTLISNTEVSERIHQQITLFRDTHQNKYLHQSLFYLNKKDFEFLNGQLAYASINYPNADLVQALVVYRDGSITTFELGDELPFKDRAIKFRLPSFLLNQHTANNTELVVIQILDTIQNSIKVELRNPTAFEKYSLGNYILYGSYFGALTILALGSLFLLFFTRELSFLWYSSYLTCAMIFLLTANGLGQAFLFPIAQSTTKLSFIAAGGMIITITFFASSFLGLTRDNKVFVTFSALVTSGVIGVCIALSFLHHGAIDDIFFALAVAQMIAVISVAISTYYKQGGLALYLILGYLVLFPALLISILKFAGFVDNDTLINHSVEFSFLGEAIIFSLGLGRKVQRLRNIEREAELEIRATKDRFMNNLINAREHEKREISVVLHNSVAQMLALIRGRLVKANKQTKDSELSEVIDLAENTMQRVRDISHTTYPHALEQLGLSHAVKQYAKTHLDHKEIDWQCDIDDEKLQERERLFLYRILQECLNNVVRHADASKVNILLNSQDNLRKLTVKDDGKGFDSKRTGFGLSTIKEYSEALGGAMRIQSSNQSGTLVEVKF